MKKRLTGLLALILTLVMTSSMTVFAADPMEVYLRAAETPLEDGTTSYAQWTATQNNTIALTDGAKLSEISVELPDGYEISGWKLWKVDSCGYLTGSYQVLGDTFTEAAWLAARTGQYGTPLLEAVLTEPGTDSGKDAEKEEQTGGGAPHVHSYEWSTDWAPTEERDGQEAYRCRVCNDVQEVRPLSAFMYWNRNIQEKIRGAAPGAAIVVESPCWMSFHEDVLKELEKRPDVSLTCEFKIKGEWYSYTIPSRAEGTTLTQEGVAWYGFLYLSDFYGRVKSE